MPDKVQSSNDKSEWPKHVDFVEFSGMPPLKIRGARPARLPSLKLRRKQAEQIPWQAGEL
jgi:hypothetical protein